MRHVHDPDRDGYGDAAPVQVEDDRVQLALARTGYERALQYEHLGVGRGDLPWGVWREHVRQIGHAGAWGRQRRRPQPDFRRGSLRQGQAAEHHRQTKGTYCQDS